MSERGNLLLRGLDKWAGIPLVLPAAAYRIFTRVPSQKTPASKIGILCPGAIGDALLLSALTLALKHKLPEADLEMLGTSANAGILELIPGLSSYASFPVKRPDLLTRYLRRQKYDILFDASQWARMGALTCAFSQAKMTVGFKTSGQFRSLPYDLSVKHSGNIHETENFLNLGRAIWPDLHAQPGLLLPAWRKGEIIYCHMWPAPGKKKYLKEWPACRWAEMIAILVKMGHEIRLTGSQSDAYANAQFIKKYFDGISGVQSIAGKYSLAELGKIFTAAAGVISVNTGIMHLAALAGAPTVGLHGATNPLRWGPIGKHARSLLPEQGQCAYLNLGFEYPKNAEPAMQHISVNNVLDSLRQLKVI